MAPMMMDPMIGFMSGMGTQFTRDRTQVNINPFTPEVDFPVLDDDILHLLEYYVSIKNLNMDLHLRKDMKEDGWIPAKSFLALKKLINMKVTEDKIVEVITNNGSDKVEVIKKDDGVFLRNKNFDEEKGSLDSIEIVKENKENSIKKFNEQQAQNAMFRNQMGQNMPNPQIPYFMMMQTRQMQMMQYYQMQNMQMRRPKNNPVQTPNMETKQPEKK